MAEYLADLSYMLFFRVRIDEDVVLVYQHAYIKQVIEDVIHKMLKSGRHICKSERHDAPFERGAEISSPFITFADMDQMVYVTEVNFCIEYCLVQAVKEVGDVG